MDDLIFIPGIVHPINMWIIIKTGPEGIRDICHLTADPFDAVEMKDKLAKREVRRQRRIDKEIAEEMDQKGYEWERKRYRLSDIKDDFCIQGWTGKKFKCACETLGDPPTKTMRYGKT